MASAKRCFTVALLYNLNYLQSYLPIEIVNFNPGLSIFLYFKDCIWKEHSTQAYNILLSLYCGKGNDDTKYYSKQYIGR